MCTNVELENFIIGRILGSIDPVGETNLDNSRFENLKNYLSLLESLLREVSCVERRHRDAFEFSRKRASEYCRKWLLETLDILKEDLEKEKEEKIKKEDLPPF